MCSLDLRPQLEIKKDEIAQVNVLTVNEAIHQQEEMPEDRVTRGHRRRKPAKERFTYPPHIVQLDEYIHGRRSKKHVQFEKAQTLITKGHSERAKNKPIVRGLCHGKRSKIFLDTGAEINVIDKGFLKQLSEEKFIKINRATKIIRCANSSRLNVEGWIRMSVTVAGRQKECKFWVIDNLFPKIILGIRAMKDFDMNLDFFYHKSI